MAEERLKVSVEVHVLVCRIRELVKASAVLHIQIVEIDFYCVSRGFAQMLGRDDDSMVSKQNV